MPTKTKPKSTAKPVALPPGVKSLLTIRQIAASLGCSTRQVQYMIHRGEYPAADARCGSDRRWKSDTHNAWVDQSTPPPKD